jgi:hypothetical protein
MEHAVSTYYSRCVAQLPAFLSVLRWVERYTRGLFFVEMLSDQGQVKARFNCEERSTDPYVLDGQTALQIRQSIGTLVPTHNCE